MLKTKVLWIVAMNTENSETMFSKHALAIGATAVCIRTTSKRLPDAIGRFHEIGMKVYGWRWPAASESAAMKEAEYVAKALIPAKLDGYKRLRSRGLYLGAELGGHGCKGFAVPVIRCSGLVGLWVHYATGRNSEITGIPWLVTFA